MLQNASTGNASRARRELLIADSIRRDAFWGVRCGGCAQTHPHLEYGTGYRPLRPSVMDSNPRCLQLTVTLTHALLVIPGHRSPVRRLAFGVACRHPGALPTVSGHQRRQLNPALDQGPGPSPRGRCDRCTRHRGLVLQRRFLNLVSFWPEIASRKARPQSCQARWQVAMKRCSRSLSGEPSL